MVFGFSPLELIGNLFAPDVDGLRPKKDSPRTLIARAGLSALKQQRNYLLTTFGFEDTISKPAEDPLKFQSKQDYMNEKKQQQKIKDTLI